MIVTFKYLNDRKSRKYLKSFLQILDFLIAFSVARISPQFMLRPRAGSYSLSSQQNKTLFSRSRKVPPGCHLLDQISIRDCTAQGFSDTLILIKT